LLVGQDRIVALEDDPPAPPDPLEDVDQGCRVVDPQPVPTITIGQLQSGELTLPVGPLLPAELLRAETLPLDLDVEGLPGRLTPALRDLRLDVRIALLAEHHQPALRIDRRSRVAPRRLDPEGRQHVERRGEDLSLGPAGAE